MRRILVTGANGFIGSRLIGRLCGDPDALVTPLVRAGSPVCAPEQVELDLANADHVAALEESGLTFDAIVHLAGSVDITLAAGARQTDPPVPAETDFARIYRDNTLATAHVASYAIRTSVRHVIFASSQTVYGIPVERPLHEDSACHPLEHYAASKLCGESLLEVAARQGLAVTVLRFGGVFASERLTGVVRRLVEDGLRKRMLAIEPEYPVPLDIVHADDLAEAIVLAMERTAPGFRRFNVSTGEPCSLNLLANAIASLIPGCRVHHGGAPQPIVELDNSRAKSQLSWRPRPLADRLAEVVLFAQRGMVH